MRELGWPVDVFSAHLYPASKGTPDDRAAFITQVTDQLAAAGAPDLPVWDTELNYGLAGPGPTNPLQTISGAEARDWVVQTAFDSLHLGIDRTYWYIWTPEPYALLGMQLTNESGAVKGLRVIDQWLVGSTWQGCVDDGTVTSCSMEKNGVPSVMAWANVDTGTFTPPAGLTQACSTANDVRRGHRSRDAGRDAGSLRPVAARSLIRGCPRDEVDRLDAEAGEEQVRRHQGRSGRARDPLPDTTKDRTARAPTLIACAGPSSSPSSSPACWVPRPREPRPMRRRPGVSGPSRRGR